MKLSLLLSFFLYSTGLLALQVNTKQEAATKKRSNTQSESPTAAVVFPGKEQFKGAVISYNIIPATNHTWCYDILVEGRVFIHQPSAPGLPGNEGFKTKEAAARVAGLAISKIKKGEMPPSISLEEMKKLKAL